MSGQDLYICVWFCLCVVKIYTYTFFCVCGQDLHICVVCVHCQGLHICVLCMYLVKIYAYVFLSVCCQDLHICVLCVWVCVLSRSIHMCCVLVNVSTCTHVCKCEC